MKQTPPFFLPPLFDVSIPGTVGKVAIRLAINSSLAFLHDAAHDVVPNKGYEQGVRPLCDASSRIPECHHSVQPLGDVILSTPSITYPIFCRLPCLGRVRLVKFRERGAESSEQCHSRHAK